MAPAKTSELHDAGSVTIGRLIDVKWSLGVAMSSNTCRNLHTPLVTLKLTIEQPDASRQTQVITLKLNEFQNFHSQLKHLSSNMSIV